MHGDAECQSERGLHTVCRSQRGLHAVCRRRRPNVDADFPHSLAQLGRRLFSGLHRHHRDNLPSLVENRSSATSVVDHRIELVIVISCLECYQAHHCSGGLDVANGYTFTNTWIAD